MIKCCPVKFLLCEGEGLHCPEIKGHSDSNGTFSEIASCLILLQNLTLVHSIRVYEENRHTKYPVSTENS